jgi:hypothetical protein
MRPLLLPLALLLLLPSPGRARGTGVKMTLVAVPPICASGDCTNQKAGICAADLDCSAGELAPSSTFSFGGKKMVVKASFSGVTNAAGMPVRTDGTIGTDDDYILVMRIDACDYAIGSGCTPDEILGEGFPMKVELKKGKGKLSVDLSPLLGEPEGTAYNIRGAELRLPPAIPGDCPGDNSVDAVTARFADDDCQTGALIGITGILTQR